jgi:hypothetical protein
MDGITLESTRKKRKHISRKPCSMEGCPRPLQARGLCLPHYKEYRASPEFVPVDRNVGTPEERFHRNYRVDPVTGCWVWMDWVNDKGYGMLNLPGERKVRAHRFSWELNHGPIPDGMKVLHKCDNPPCVNETHLFLGTAQDNARDMVLKGRQWAKPGVSPVKLTWAKVTQIRIMYARGKHSAEKIAWIYGVDPQTIGRILKGQHWQSPPLF